MNRPALNGLDAAAPGESLAAAGRAEPVVPVREVPERRSALLEEAVEVAKALGMSNPYREKVLARALTARQREPEGRPAQPLTPDGQEKRRTFRGWTLLRRLVQSTSDHDDPEARQDVRTTTSAAAP
ncbi:hypothetical protein [Streptomyces sp. NPDC005476]|uniref:hypothetical protein n=1 Tax=Streptomyces sp. NPDC005476 TaxID=3156882 RepID=UPI00345426FB